MTLYKLLKRILKNLRTKMMKCNNRKITIYNKIIKPLKILIIKKLFNRNFYQTKIYNKVKKII